MTAYSWCGSFKIPTVDEGETKPNDNLGRRRMEGVIEPQSGEDASAHLRGDGGVPTVQGIRQPIFSEASPSLNPPLTAEYGSYGVEYRLPFKLCETCGRRTGWICTFGKFNSHRMCAKCMGALHRRLVENIHRVNDGKEPLPMDVPRRDAV